MSHNKEIHVHVNRQRTRIIDNTVIRWLQYFRSTSSLKNDKHHLAIAATTDRIAILPCGYINYCIK